MNIFIEPEEIEKLADLILALRTKMEECNVKSVNIKTGEVNYSDLDDKSKVGTYVWDDKKHKPVLKDAIQIRDCTTCAYANFRFTDPPCSTCGYEEGRYDNWKERTETE